MLSKKQKRLARDLYEGRFTEEEMKERYKVSDKVFERWLSMCVFQEELVRLRESSQREAQFSLMRYGPMAVLRLAELMGSDKPDVARRAATDLVDRCLKMVRAGEVASEEDEVGEMSDDDARRMLVKLAAGYKKISN